MNIAQHLKATTLACMLAGCMYSQSALAQTSPNPSTPQPPHVLRDGQHDFDFNIGIWKTHYRRLLHPLSGSTDWVEFDGRVSVRKIWDGRAQLEEIEANAPTGRWEGLTLFLYNPQAHQWSQYFANSSGGVLDQPAIGEFKDGRGEFFDQEAFNGRTILVRLVWSEITPDSHRLEQSFSDDGGKSWEPNFIATMVRDKTPQTTMDSSTFERGAHDFDFNFGIWKTHISRLQHPLTGSNAWVDYDGTANVSRVWNGLASLFELEAAGPAGHIEGVGLRLYNPKSRQWSLNWANSTAGVMTKPMIGSFVDGQGRFFDQEEFEGRSILTRNGFSEIKSDSSRFEQAFSDDGGKSWETNWIMTFTR